MKQIYNNLKNNELSDENEYINLKVFFDILIRNKNYIAPILEKVWQGNFQIFIDQKDNY